MKLALKAQSQCRTTLDSLASMKNPAVHMRQTNIANNQQVNNGPEIEKPPRKLDGTLDREKWMDGGTTKEAIGANVEADSSVETVGEIDGTENA